MVLKEKVRKQSCHEEKKNRASKEDEDEEVRKIQATTLGSSDNKEYV